MFPLWNALFPLWNALFPLWNALISPVECPLKCLVGRARVRVYVFVSKFNEVEGREERKRGLRPSPFILYRLQMSHLRRCHSLLAYLLCIPRQT